MSNKLNDDRVRHIDKLDTPKQIKEEFPVTPQIEKLVLQSRQNIQDILDNKSKRLVVIVGPCSIHDKQIAIEYAQFLAIQREIYKDTLEIVMRTYFTKPRTTTGWKGFIYDPDMKNVQVWEESVPTDMNLADHMIGGKPDKLEPKLKSLKTSGKPTPQSEAKPKRDRSHLRVIK